jgi:lipoic acid synthetase
MADSTRRLPRWLRPKAPRARALEDMARVLGSQGLHTICQSARCPNAGECYGRGLATFLILGDRCTRNCRFCAVEAGAPDAPDPAEPERIAQAARNLGLKHVVVTSVTRDDLPDGGAAHFAAVVGALREAGGATVELLVPDFGGDWGAPEEVEAVLRDLRGARVDLLTIGQYLRPTPQHAAVAEYVRPEAFAAYQRRARALGFREAACGPLVRSSYHAGELLPCP